MDSEIKIPGDNRTYCCFTLNKTDKGFLSFKLMCFPWSLLFKVAQSGKPWAMTWKKPIFGPWL
jgi:hypothetical protein